MSSEDTDDAFQEILAGYVDRLNAGEMISREEILDAHPELADEILEQLAIFREIGTGGEASSELSTFGDYEIVSEIGRGGMGVVYEAIDRNMDRRVALKVLPAGLKIHAKSVVRFRREARIVAKLQHPNIVAVYATGIEDKTPYIAMELVEGESLEKILERKRPRVDEDTRRLGSRILTEIHRAFVSRRTAPASPPTSEEPPKDKDTDKAEGDAGSRIPSNIEEMDLRYCISMAETFAGVAEGLQHAHSRGVIHRDLKPSNLILDSKGNLRILDFGLAHLEGQQSLTGSGEILGTLQYMSPEQARARKVVIDHRTDVYSLGATLYEVLTLRPPFHGRNSEETLSQIVHRDPRPPFQLNPLIPKDLDTIILKCLRKNPADRYGTAEALAQDLRRFAHGAPVEARPRSWGEKLAHRAWQHRVTLAAALVLLLLASSIAWLLYDKARAKREIELARYEPQVKSAIMKLEIGGLLELGSGRFVWGSEGWNLEPLLRGLAVGNEEYLDRAITTLRTAAAAVPERPDAYYHLGRALLLRGDGEEAVKALERAIDLGFVPAMVLCASHLERQGDREAADGLLERARNSGDDVWSGAWFAAHGAVLERRWREAADAYGRLVDRLRAAGEPYLGASIEIYLGRGLARFELKEFGPAREDLAAASVLWREAMEPELFLAFAHYGEGNAAEADRIFEELHGRSPSNEVALHIGVFYLYCGQPGKALRWMQRVSSPSLRDIFVGTCLRSMGRRREALDSIERAVERRPEFAFPYFALGQLSLEAGDHERAAALAQRAIQMAPDAGMPYALLGWALENAGDVERSLDYLREGARIEPGFSAIHVQLGLMLKRRGRLAEAARELEKALEIERRRTAGSSFFNDGRRELLLGEIYGDLGTAPEALDLFSRAVEANLANPIGVDRLYLYDSLRGLLSREDLPELGGELDRFVQLLERKIERAISEEAPGSLLVDNRATLVHALLRRAGRKDRLSKALASARELLQSTGGLDSRTLVLLARALLLNDKKREATAMIERALRLPAHGLNGSVFLEPPLREYLENRVNDLLSYEAIDEALNDLRREELISEGARWRFFRGIRAPSDGILWTAPDFDDASWESGPSGFGYGDGDDATVIDDMQNRYTTLYVRHAFPITEPRKWRRLILSVKVDDGFVAYLNGTEIGRNGVRWEPVFPHDGTAYGAAPEPLVPAELEVDPGLIRPGKNLLALQGVNLSLTSTDFSLIPILRGEPHQQGAAIRPFLEEFRARARGENVEGRIAFLEGRLAQAEGELEVASERFAEALAHEPESDVARVALAECLRSAGKVRQAERTLREALERLCPGFRNLWDLWSRISLVDLEMSSQAVLEEFPCRDSFGPDGVASSGLSGGYGADLHWVFTELKNNGAVRLNCAGTRYESEDGRVWGRDRFLINVGRTSRHFLTEIEDTADDPLYQIVRIFPSGTLSLPGYRIPLPRGRYRLTLHFAEADVRLREPGQRVFDVLVEGNMLLEKHDSFARAGHSTAYRVEHTLDVTDGHLDIEFVRHIELPSISAIEIEAIE